MSALAAVPSSVTTWVLVRTWPSPSRMMPEPVPPSLPLDALMVTTLGVAFTAAAVMALTSSLLFTMTGPAWLLLLEPVDVTAWSAQQLRGPGDDSAADEAGGKNAGHEGGDAEGGLALRGVGRVGGVREPGWLPPKPPCWGWPKNGCLAVRVLAVRLLGLAEGGIPGCLAVTAAGPCWACSAALRTAGFPVPRAAVGRLVLRVHRLRGVVRVPVQPERRVLAALSPARGQPAGALKGPSFGVAGSRFSGEAPCAGFSVIRLPFILVCINYGRSH